MNESKRIACGHLCGLLFQGCCAISFQLRQMTSRSVLTSNLAHGLTKQEQVLVNKLADRIYADGEILRKLSRRFEGMEII